MTKLLEAYLKFAKKNEAKLKEATSNYAYEEDTYLNATMTLREIQYRCIVMEDVKLQTLYVRLKNLMNIKKNQMVVWKRLNLIKLQIKKELNFRKKQ